MFAAPCLRSLCAVVVHWKSKRCHLRFPHQLKGIQSFSAPPLRVRTSVCDVDVLVNVEVKLQGNEGKRILAIPHVSPPIVSSDVVLVVCGSVGVYVEMPIAATVLSPDS